MKEITVIKLGGSLLDDVSRRSIVLGTIAARWRRGDHVVLVHGGGKHIDAMLSRLGILKRTHAGLRITDDATLDVVVSVLGGLVNKSLVAELTAEGVRAAGISGSDASIIVAEQHAPIDGIDLGHVGHVVASDNTLIEAMLDAGILPVISSVAEGPNGSLLNVNADWAASAIAVGVQAKELLFFTDVAGFLDEHGNVVELLHDDDAEALIESGGVAGGMRPKLQAAVGAIRSGIRLVAIGDSIHNGLGGTRLVAA